MDVRKQRLFTVAKWLCYLLIFMLFAVLQTMPGFLAVGNVKPVLLVPYCIAVALYEGEFAGALFGAFSGLVWDMLSGRVMGFFAIGLMLSCFAASVLVQMFLKENSTNMILISAAVMLFITGCDFLFGYIMPGYGGVVAYYIRTILPMIIFTAAISPIMLISVKQIYNSFILEE